jgi:vitamin B12 transporter
MKAVSIELGGRGNFHSQYGQNFTYSFNPSYQMHEQVKLFANVSTGYKAPTLYQLYGEFGANPNLTPERSQSLEAGFQLSSRTRKSDVRVVGFQRHIDDVIFYNYPQGYTNQDEQRDKGFEVESFHTISKKVSLNLFYSFVDGYVLTPALGDKKTNNLFRRPKNSIGVQLTAQISQRFSVSVNAKTFGKRKDLYFNIETFQQEVVDLKAYQLVDLHAEYTTKNKRLRLFADARNLLNQNYFEVYGYSTLPINFNGGISYHVGN